MSLCKKLRVSQDTFRQVLVKERVLAKHGSGYRFKVERAKVFFLTSCETIDAEIAVADLRKRRRYFIRLGNKKTGYFKSVIDQVAARVLHPKRHIIQSMRRLHALQHAVGTSLACDLSESEGDSSSENDTDHEMSNVTKYKILSRLGIDLD